MNSRFADPPLSVGNRVFPIVMSLRWRARLLSVSRRRVRWRRRGLGRGLQEWWLTSWWKRATVSRTSRSAIAKVRVARLAVPWNEPSPM